MHLHINYKINIPIYFINKENSLKKQNTFFFQIFFFHKCKLWIVWNSFTVKIILISQKYLFWGYSKWQQIKQSAPGLNKSLFIKFLMAKIL